MSTLRTTMTALALAATVALSGCGDDGPESEATSTPSETVAETPSETLSGTATESPSESPSVETDNAVEVTIKGDTISPTAEPFEIGVGEVLLLQVESDRTGELHVHSNPEQTFAITPGDQDIEIVLDRPGQVDIEEHVSGELLLRVLVR